MRSHGRTMGSGQPTHPKKPNIPPRTNQHNILPRWITHHIPCAEQILQKVWSTHYPIIDFKEHFMHITKDVRKLAKALTNRKLSPTYKTLVVEQLLKSKYHATHLGVLNDRQLTTIDGILIKTMRQAIALLPNFPTEGVHRPQK